MRAWVLMSIFVASACESGTAEPELVLSPTLLGQAPVDTQQVGTLPGHGTRPELSVESRGPRRVSVSQIERSWDIVGGYPPGTIKIPASLYSSLGQPDWLSTTEANLEPSPLFMKFMTDLSILICRGILAADAARPLEDRILLPPGSDIDRHIQSLLLRFWSLDVDTGHEEVGRLRAVYEQVASTSRDPAEPWGAVCIALTTAPAFLLY